MEERDYSKKIITIPNLLSMFRLVLAFVFFISYTKAESREEYWISLGILLVSAFTDVMDGKIARHFHMISEVGKILDPVADKVTQGFVMLALISRYPLMGALFAIFLVKECYMSGMGLKVLRTTGWNGGAMWYGKLNTVVLYAVSILLILYYNMPYVAANCLIGICCISILFCFYHYHIKFKEILKQHYQEQ
ncbi:MAG: CDP-alcohol phosphatidyltransferase family protein [Lachnospiraceae bacterium]